MLNKTCTETLLKAVAEFNDIFSHDPSPALARSLVEEEANEVITAALEMNSNPTVETTAEFLKEVADLHYVMAGMKLALEKHPKDAEEMEGPTPEGYGAVQWANALVMAAFDSFLDPVYVMEAVTDVHYSNLSKVDDNGQPIRNADGKVQKGPNYTPPNLDNLAEEVLMDFKAASSLEEMEVA
jgi:phosphoribosyl-ATP pyrophosphohydrolase